MVKTRQWTLKSNPNGRTTKDDFEIVEADLPAPNEGEILVKSHYISVDPYMRGRISKSGSSYAKPHAKGEIIAGAAVGEVVESKSPTYQVGDIVVHFAGWQEYAVVPAAQSRKVDPALGPISSNLGVLGITGLTAYFGLLDITNPKEGETVLVSTAAGAVGSIVGQIAKIRGARVVGITSTDEKVAFVKSLGFDEVINYKTTPNLRDAIKAACPKGIDVYFDNVGGETLEIAVELLNAFGRISLCGGITDYDNIDGKLPKGPNLTRLIGIQGKIEGFLVSRWAAKWGEGLKQLSEWISEGKIKAHETTFEGFEKVPEAFISLFEGANIGKVVVKLV